MKFEKYFFLLLALLIFVPLPVAEADGDFLPCKSIPQIRYKMNSFLGDYNTALSESINHWSSIPQLSVGIDGSAKNTITLASYSDTWFGQHMGTCSGNVMTKSVIKINSRTVNNSTNVLNRKNFARSTITHEIGHAFGLDDNPIPSKPNSSLMNHNRDRLVIYKLTNYDINTLY